MLGKVAKPRNKWNSSSKAKRKARKIKDRRRLWLEPLEDRTLLDINFATMARLLSTDLGNLTTSLSQEFSKGDPIPLVGNQLSQVDALSGPFTNLTNELSGLGVSSDPNAKIQNIVSPNDPNVTAASVFPSTSTDTQVTVTISLSGQPGTPTPILFSLGSLKDVNNPNAFNTFLTVSSSQNFQVSEGFSFTLTFHYDDRANSGAGSITNLGGPLTLNVAAQSTSSNQPLTFTGFLNDNPDSNHASLYAQGTDNNNQTKLSTHLGITVDPNAGNVTDISLNDGLANLDTNLNLRFGDPSRKLPFNLTPQADLKLTWSFNNNSIFGPQNQLGQLKTHEFDTVKLGLSSLVQGIGDSVIHRIQEFTGPLQPIANFLGAELPGLSSLGIHVSLASVFGLGDLVSFVNAANDAVNAFSSFESQAGDDISYGNLVIGAPDGNVLGALLSGQETIVADMGGSDGMGHVNPTAPSLFQQLEKPLSQGGLHVPDETSGDQNQNKLSVNVAFPIVDSTTADQCPLFQLLEGDVNAQFFKLTAGFSITKSIDLPPVPISFILLEPSFNIGLGINVSFGYDASGLKAAANDNSTSMDALANDLKTGFFFDVTKTNIQLNVGMTLTANALIAQVTGTLGSTVTWTLLQSDQQVGNPGVSPTERHFDSNLQEGFSGDSQCGFGSNLSGDIYLEIDISIGFDIPFVGHVTFFSFGFPKIDLLSFSTMCSAGQPGTPPPTIEVPIGNGDHTIHIHRYTVVADPSNTQFKRTGIEVDDSSNDMNWPSSVQRYPLYDFNDQTGKVIKSYGQVSQIVAFPVEIFGGSPISGKDSITIDQDVVGDSNQDAVRVLMIGHDGQLNDPTDKNGDDFEYFGKYAPLDPTVGTQVVMIGGKGNNKLVGGQLEFGGGAPPNVADNIKAQNYSDFPIWAQNLSVHQVYLLIGNHYQPADQTVNPLASVPIMVAQDGSDVLVGTPGNDVLYGGSTSNAFVGLGGGDVIHGDAGNPFNLGVNNTFLESALDNYPNAPGTNTQEDNNIDYVLGGDGVNSLQFVGFVDHENTDNIAVHPIFPDSNGFYPYILVSDGQKEVFAKHIDKLAIEADSGSVFVDNLVSTDVSKVDVSFTHSDSQEHRVTVNTTEITGTSSNYLDGHWTVALDPTTGGTSIMTTHGLAIGVQGLTSFKIGGPSSPDQIVLDDTGRIRSSRDTIDIQSLPLFGPDLTVNLGPGTDQVNITPPTSQGPNEGLFGLHQSLVTVNGYSLPLQISADTLTVDDSVNFEDSQWTIGGSAVKRLSDSPFTNQLDTEVIDYTDISTLNLIGYGAGVGEKFDISPDNRNLDEIPNTLSISMGKPMTIPMHLNIFNQQDDNAENWTVTANEIARSHSYTDPLKYLTDRQIFLPTNGSPPVIDIFGGGASQFNLDPANGSASGGYLAELQMLLTIHGNGSADTLVADDSNNPSTTDVTWKVSGSDFENSTFTQGQQIQFSGIENLQIIYPNVFNIFDFGGDAKNLDDLPENVQLYAGSNHPQGLDVAINDQNNGQHFDVQNQLNPTTWTILDDSITRQYVEKRETANVLVTRNIGFGILPVNLTIMGGSGGNAFQVQRTGSLQFVPPMPPEEPPTLLTIDGGGGNNSLTTSDGIYTTYTLQPDTFFKKQLLLNTTNNTFDSFYADTVIFKKIGKVTIDDSAPSSAGPGDPQPFYTFNVLGTDADTTTDLLGSPGAANSFNVADASSILGPVQIQGGGSDNTINRILGVQEFSLPAQVGRPNTIMAGPDNALWITDLADGTIGRVTTTGAIAPYSLQTFGNMVTGPDGKIWFEDQNGNLARFDPANPVATASLVYQPTAPISSNLVSTPTGVWFSEFDSSGSLSQIVRVDRSGSPTMFSLSATEIVHYLARSLDGNSVWFLEQPTTAFSSPNFLGMIDSQGSFPPVPLVEKSTGLPLAPGLNLTGLTAGPDGNLWGTAYLFGSFKVGGKFADIGKLLQINAQGQVTTFKMPNNDPSIQKRASFINSKPAGIVAGPDGHLWFVDEDRGEIDVLTTSGGVQEFTFPQAVALTPGPDNNMWFIGESTIGRIFNTAQTALWQINGPDTGQLYGNVLFNSVQNLNGGVSADTFAFDSQGTISGKVSGGIGPATLDESQSPGMTVTSDGPGTGTLHGSMGTATNIGGGFDNIDTILSNNGSAVVFDDSNDPNPATWTITPTSVSLTSTPPVGAPVTVTTPIGNASTVIIKAGSGANNFNLQEGFVSPPSGSPFPPSGVNIPIEFDLSSKSAINSLSMMDTTGLPDDMVLNGNSLITQVGLPALDGSGKDAAQMTVNIGSIQFPNGIMLHPNGSSTVEVYGNPLNSPTTVKSGGNETITVGNGILDAFLSSLNINSDPDTLVINDQSETNPETYTLTSNSLTRTGSPTIFFSGLASLTINGGSGGNTFDIVNTPVGAITTVNSGTGNDFVNVLGNSSYPNMLFIDGVGGQDVVTVGSLMPDAASFGSAEGGHATSSPNGGGTLANIQGAVIVHNSSGQTALIVDESGVTVPVRTIGMSLVSQDLDVLGPATGNGGIYFNRTGQVQSVTYFGPQVGSNYIIYSTNGIPNTYLNLGPGNDTVVVLATLGPLTINGGGGNDTVTIGGQLPIHGGGVSEIGPSIVLSNPTGTMALTVDDSNVSTTLDGFPNKTSRNATITATSITGMPAGTTIDYTNANLTSLTILGGAFGNIFAVYNTPAGAVSTLDSGNGVDTVYVFGTTGPLTVNTQQGGTSPGFQGFEKVFVGGPAGTAGTLDTIQGALTINTLGRPGVDFATLALFDLATTTPETYTITSNTILRSGAAPIYYRVSNELEFRLGSGGNLVNIQSTFPGLPDLFVGGLGNDTFNVGDSANTLNGIQSNLFFQIANPGSQVILHDEGDAGNVNYTLAHDPAISPYNFVQRSNSSYYIVYSGPLKALQLNAGAGNDSFNVRTQPPSSTTVTLDGGGGTNTLEGANQNNNWQITAPNSGSLDTNIQFANVHNLMGGTANDTFGFKTGGSLEGTINGAGGTDTLDYSGYTGDVTVNMRVSAGNGEPGALATGVAGGISNITNVFGSIGNDLIVGDANPHAFTGGTGRNIIIGGAGPDQITGGGGDNILIGGTTLWDANPTALQAIMQEWTNDTLSFDQRVNALRKGITVGGQTYALNTSTVMKDSSLDSLIGGGGQNWFFVDFDDIINNGAGPGPNDRVTRV